jgi:hypothetical protein
MLINLQDRLILITTVKCILLKRNYSLIPGATVNDIFYLLMEMKLSAISQELLCCREMDFFVSAGFLSGRNMSLSMALLTNQQ